jgi:hypothetical protein
MQRAHDEMLAALNRKPGSFESRVYGAEDAVAPTSPLGVVLALADRLSPKERRALRDALDDTHGADEPYRDEELPPPLATLTEAHGRCTLVDGEPAFRVREVPNPMRDVPGE